MKKFLFLGLIAMLLYAPLPMSAKTATFVVDSNNGISIETYKDLISFEGGTYIGFHTFSTDNWNAAVYSMSGLEYEFDDNQTTTRLHADLSNIKIALFTSDFVDGFLPQKESLIFNTGESTSSAFISDEIGIPDGENIFRMDIYHDFSPIVTLIGEGLSGQLRDNHEYHEWVESWETTYLRLVYEDYFDVLNEKQAPLEDTEVKGLGRDKMSFCINGFNWTNPSKSIILIIDGDTVKDLRQYREQHLTIVDNIRYPQKTVQGDGIDIMLNKASTTIYAKLIDVPETFEISPITYRINGSQDVTVKSVDKTYSGDFTLPTEVEANYLSGWKVTGIDEAAMLNCKKITSLTIPSTITTIGTNALSGMSALQQIRVSTENKKFASVDGVLYSKNLKTLLQYPIAKGIQFEVPSGTTTLGRDAFYKSNLTSITLPSTLTTIDYDAFGYCTKLTELTLPTSVKTIGEYTFDHCSELASVSLPSVKILPKYTFNSCTALTNVSLSTSLQKIEDYAFNSCTSLTSLVLPTTLQAIGEGAFKNCTKLSSINLPQIPELPNSVFYGCSSLTSIVLPSSIQSVGEQAFYNCTALNTITCWMANPVPMPDNAFPTEVYENALLMVPLDAEQQYRTASGWKNFKNIVEVIYFVDANVKAICIANWDTNGDSELDKAEAAAVTSLGSVFTGNTTITSFNELQYFTGLTKIDDSAFKGCKLLKSVIVPANVTEIGKYAFYACYDLTDIVLPEGLLVISDNGIAACTKLTGIELPSTLTTLKTKAFYYDKKLASISLPASVTSIGASAFSSCSVLLEVTANMQSPCAIASTVFTDNTYNNATLTVPYGTYDLYKTTNYWSKFVNITMMEAGLEIAANPISIVAGESGTLNLALYGNLPAVSFQFDLTLANGITLEEASVIPASDFIVSNAKVGTNQWRILAYSPTNTPIGGNIGNLMALTLQTEELLTAGSRYVAISNFVLSSAGKNNIVSSVSLDDITTLVTVLDAVVTDAGKGDVNLDGTVNVQDIVVLINHIFGTTPKKFSASNADANSDGVINVADVSSIVFLCMPTNSANVAPAHAPAASMATVSWDTTDGLKLSIDDATSYVAAQMDVTTEGMLNLHGIETEDGHTAVWQQIGDHHYRVLVFSNANETFSAFGPHLFFDVEGDGSVSLSDVLLVDAEGEGFTGAPTSTGYTTGITTITNTLSAPADVYNMSGQLIRKQTTTLKDLPAGIYIVNGKKMVVK